MFKKVFNYVKETIEEEYKFIIFLILLYIILQYPMNYYITIGGGTSDVSSRIKVEDAYSNKGSFSISYVTQLEGTLLSYGLSYIVPGWERESADDYKYNVEESIKDIEFRGELDLNMANGNATYWAYNLAHKTVTEKESHLYVIAIADGFKPTLKVQDEILSIDGNSYHSVSEYRDYLQTKKKNDIVKLDIKRGKKEKTIETKLYEKDGKILLGVGLQYVTSYATDPKVNIKFKRSESGPSGGLITTLEIYNQLTKKDLTKGLKIAGTGTIEQDGTIGQIGGVEHKVLGASHDKADYFLVPSGENYKDAIKYIKKKGISLKIIEVKSIQDAIQKLENLK